MKTVIVCVILLVMMINAVSLTAQSLTVRYGRNLTPSDHLSLRYEHWTNGALNLSLGGFMERSRKSNLNLSVYGLELLTEYASNGEGYTAGVFGWRCGLGAGWQVENEPWIYKDWPLKRRSAFSVLGELGGEWFMTDQFSLRAFLQQKFLFNPMLGNKRFLLGLNLSYRLGM